MSDATSQAGGTVPELDPLTLFTPSEGVRIVENITPAGLNAAADRGDLPVVRTSSGRRLFTRQALEEFKQRRREREARRAAQQPQPAAEHAK
jgi:hypothetical protein